MSSKNIYIPSKKQISEMIWHEYVYEPMLKEDIQKEQDVKVGGWFGERNGMYGKTISDEQKAAISKAAKKHKPWLKTTRETCVKGGHASKIGERTSKPIVIEGKEYPSASEASRQLGIHQTTISHRARSENFPAYSYK